MVGKKEFCLECGSAGRHATSCKSRETNRQRWVESGVIEEWIENEASALVRDGERERKYGPPGKDWERTAGMWSSLLGVKITAQQAMLMMICVKLSRLMETPEHHDSMVDVIGYMICYDRLKEWRNE